MILKNHIIGQTLSSNPQKLPYIIASIGVVFGDIGTSPLYAIQSCFTIAEIPVTELNVMGVISLICSALFFIVTLKYVNLVLTIDHKGEGGILVLSGFCSKMNLGKYKIIPLFLGIVGTALFIGDGVITPAISVLSALEGISLVSKLPQDFIVWMAAIILLCLFLVQKRGSSTIGKFFGPVMIVWFITIGAIGIYSLTQTPIILKSLNPYYAALFFYENGFTSLLVLGGTVLVITGAEALYADLSHFGKVPISIAWNYFVFPCLLLNYLGQGALLLRSPQAIENLFYLSAPSFALYPLIAISTIATIIASQSIISGVFSLSMQAVMLNFLPRMRVIHTSYQLIGQVYVPCINYILCILTIFCVLIFRKSDSLAVAYGLNASGVMLITTAMLTIVAFQKWEWSINKILLLLFPLLFVDFVFFTTNLYKIFEGGVFTILVALAICFIIATWIIGGKKNDKLTNFKSKNLIAFMLNYQRKWKERIPGTAIFICNKLGETPDSLKIHLDHNKFLHEKMIFVCIVTDSKPKCSNVEKYKAEKIDKSSVLIKVKYGFKEIPDLSKIFSWAIEHKLVENGKNISYYFSKTIPIIEKKLSFWNFFRLSRRVYAFLAKNSLAEYDFYKVHQEQVIEYIHRYKL